MGTWGSMGGRDFRPTRGTLRVHGASERVSGKQAGEQGSMSGERGRGGASQGGQEAKLGHLCR